MTSVSSILNGAFGLIRDNFPATLVWCGCYLVVTVGSAFYWAPIQLAMFAPEDPAQAFGRMPALLASYGLFVLGCAAIQMILLTAAYRAVLRPTQSGFGFIRFGADELREIVLGIAMMAAFYALLVGGLVAIFAAGVLLGSTGTAGMVLGILLAIIFSLAFVGLCIWLAVRLCLAFPLTLLRRRFAIGEAWRLSRGHFWSLFGALLVIFVLYVVATSVVGSMTAASYLSALGEAGLFGPDATIDPGQQATLISTLTRITPMNVAGWIIGGLVGGIFTGLSGGATATAVKELVGDHEEVAARFA